MKIESFKNELLSDKLRESLPTSRKILRERAVELAISDGRSALEATKEDWEQAKRELSYESESEHWSPESDSSRKQLRSENDLSADGGDFSSGLVEADCSPMKPAQALNGDLTQRQIDE